MFWAGADGRSPRTRILDRVEDLVLVDRLRKRSVSSSSTNCALGMRWARQRILSTRQLTSSLTPQHERRLSVRC